MTKMIGGVLHIKTEEESSCETCGKMAELRPYGPNGEKICFECGMKDEHTTRKKMLNKYGIGENNIPEIILM